MSNMRRLAAGVFLLSTSAWQGAFAQDAAHYRALADSLTREWRRLNAAERRRDSVAASGVRLDSTQVGPLMVLSPSGQTEHAVAGARMALHRVRGLLGRDTMLLTRPYFLRPARVRQPFALPHDLAGMLYQPGAGPESIAASLVHQLQQDLAWLSGPAFRAWTGGVVPLDKATQLELGRAFRELVGSGIAGSSDCIRGDVAACAAILGVRAPMTLRHEYPIEDARRTLLQVALELGGEGSFGRLLATEGSVVADQLEAAADQPLDAVVSTWHQAVIAARPESTVLTRKGVWVAFVWIVLFGTIASRSSRWRLA